MTQEQKSTPVPPDQVLTQLRTRGFETGGFGSPLRHFRGKLDSIAGAMVQRGNMPQARLELTYNFSDVEVFVSTEPYPFPIAQISMLHSNRVKSGMGVLGASIDKIINAGLDENAPQEQAKNQDFLTGKVQEWKFTAGHMMPDRDDQGNWTEKPREAWEVVYVEGVGGTAHSGAGAAAPVAGDAPAPVPAATEVTPIQQALNLLDGKTQQEWNNIVFQDPIVKADAALTNSIIGGTFLSPMVESGMLTVDENQIYHVVPQG